MHILKKFILQLTIKHLVKKAILLNLLVLIHSSAATTVGQDSSKSVENRSLIDLIASFPRNQTVTLSNNTTRTKTQFSHTAQSTAAVATSTSCHEIVDSEYAQQIKLNSIPRRTVTRYYRRRTTSIKYSEDANGVNSYFIIMFVFMFLIVLVVIVGRVLNSSNDVPFSQAYLKYHRKSPPL